jgi:hypothetical protein
MVKRSLHFKFRAQDTGLGTKKDKKKTSPRTMQITKKYLKVG